MSGRRWRRPSSGARSQHYLRDRRLAAGIADFARLGPSDLVMELGAGYGSLTEQLAARAGRVIAVELDPRLAARLTGRLASKPNVTVVIGDALQTPLPRRPFRIVSNPPFHITAPLLHRLLDDPRTPLQRADLILSWGAALALTGLYGPAHKARRWSHRYEFLLIRRLPAGCFEPAPSTDAALVSIRRLSGPI